MSTENESPVACFSRMVRELTNEGETDLRPAARAIVRQDPDLALEVIETIGSWPSSEPELRALQQVWG